MLYEITYKDRFWEEMQDEPGPLTFCIYEYISVSLTKVFPTARVLQVESRQILSVLDEVDDVRMDRHISELLSVLSLDENYYFATIAVSPPFLPTSDFPSVYEQTVSLLQERKLMEGSQVVRESAGRPFVYLLTPAQEQQFERNLSSGNAQELLHLLDRHLALMERKDATFAQYHEFVRDIVQKVRRSLHASRLQEQDIEPLLGALNSSQSFYSVKHYRKFFSQLLVAACQTIQYSRKVGDPIVAHVTNYVEKNYGEDITLDIVAEQLRITGGYLSTYFKEKTGEYFVDYVNRIRVEKAQHLLLETPMKIQEISNRCGYQNINTFNRIFKKYSGMSPRDFRKDHFSGNVS
ncbi:helix-turn-helix domain-containing protein [Paenibacillus sp. CC-CFT747]|nr:helix-turn-helix domain-containing protein [Paenibacillus sp. CC-CFT747]